MKKSVDFVRVCILGLGKGSYAQQRPLTEFFFFRIHPVKNILLSVSRKIFHLKDFCAIQIRTVLSTRCYDANCRPLLVDDGLNNCS